MLQHRDQHGGNAEHRIAAIGPEHFQHQSGLEGLDQHRGRGFRHRADHAADAAAGVKQRHRGDEDVAGIDAHAVGGVGAVVEQSAMAEQGAFRKARGARGVLDHDGIVGTDGRQLDALVVARGDEGVPVVEADDLAQFRAVRRHRLHRLQHRVAAKAVDDEDAGRARLLQHILHLARAKGRVHGNEDHARHAGAEFEHHPFREVLRPDGNALARLEARQQRAGGALGFAIKLRVGPLTAQFWVGDARNQGQAIGRRLQPPCAGGRRTSSPAPQASPGLRRATSSMSSNPPRSGDGAVLAAGVSIVPRRPKCLPSPVNASGL